MPFTTINITTNFDIVEKLSKMEEYMRKRMYAESYALVRGFQKEVRQRVASGYYGIERKTGALSRSVFAVRRQITPSLLELGIEFKGNENTPHINTHVGTGTQEIVAKNSNYLWIPLKDGPAYRKRGKDIPPSAYGWAKQGGLLTVVNIKGNLFAVQKAKEKPRNILKWYYILKKSVQVPRRINPAEIEAEIFPILNDKYFEIFERVARQYWD